MTDCTPNELGMGGNVVTCDGGRTLVKQGAAPSAPVEIQILAPRSDGPPPGD